MPLSHLLHGWIPIRLHILIGLKGSVFPLRYYRVLKFRALRGCFDIFLQSAPREGVDQIV